MAEYKILSAVTGTFEANCYLIIDKNTGSSALIDPGFYCNGIVNMLKRENIKELDYILLTHGHMDHICGASYVRKNFGGKIVIGEEDAECVRKYLFDVAAPDYKSTFIPCEPDIILKDETPISFGNDKIDVIFTPGHTAGEYCFAFENYLFSGDVLFKDCVGRWDLNGGNVFILSKSLKKINNKNKDYIILPGHGERTTLLRERKYNRYFSRMIGEQKG